jgi:DNA recombination protein RmuC
MNILILISVLASFILLVIVNVITLLNIANNKRIIADNAQKDLGLNQFQIRINEFVTRLDERERIQEKIQTELKDNLSQLLKEQREEQTKQRTDFNKHQFENLKQLMDSLQKGMADVRSQIAQVLTSNAQTLSERLTKLTDETNQRLKEINGQVEKRLAEGFEKTTATFSDIVKRLALIDKAQEKITELSTNVVSLQEILSDKRSRGAFGEVQLTNLIRNMLPENNFEFQHQLTNDKRADCALFLPAPTGKVVIDAKFPLENYQRLSDFALSPVERTKAQTSFYNDVKKHIKDISEKYIIPGETADFALMFIPAEAVFAEIHAHNPELVNNSYQSRVWMVSPTTMMAILTTASAVIKDESTRKQVNIIREHLKMLGEDFKRFQERMDNLAKHIKQANNDVDEVRTSSQKITARFDKIERVEFKEDIKT